MEKFSCFVDKNRSCDPADQLDWVEGFKPWTVKKLKEACAARDLAVRMFLILKFYENNFV